MKKSDKADRRLAVLTNIVSANRLAIYEEMAKLSDCRVFVDAKTESNRSWAFRTGGVDVSIVKSISIGYSYRHDAGYCEQTYLHIPYSLLGSLLAYRPSNILTAELGVRSAVALLYRCWNRECRVSVWVEGTLSSDSCRGRLRALWRRVVLPLFDSVIVTSSASRDYVTALCRDSVRPVLLGQASGLKSPDGGVSSRTAGPRRRWTSVGQLTERKGVRLLLEALHELDALLSSRSVELWVVGDGPLMDAVSSTQLSRIKMVVLGHKEYDELPEIYSQCGVLLFPSLGDVWGLVTIEAQLYGLAVIGSKHAASSIECISDGSDGWIVDPYDRKAFVTVLFEVAKLSSLTLREMGRRSYEKASRVSVAEFAQHLLEASYCRVS